MSALFRLAGGLTSRVALSVTLSVALAGCASTSPDASFRAVAAAVEQRTGHKARWIQGGAEDAEVDAAVRSMLKRELSADGAVQIALLKNRGLQAEYEELRVAQADVVQAGLLKNPAFEAGVRFPTTGPLLPAVDLGVEQDFLSLLFLPARKKLAASELERAKLRAGAAVIDLASEVRIAYFTLQGAQQVAALRRTIAEAAHISAELAKRQEEAGTLSDLDAAGELGLYEQVRIELARSEGEVLVGRERLTRLMGLWGAEAAWKISDMLPDLPPADPPLAHVESLAIKQRLDVAAAREGVQIAAHALSIASSGRFFGAADVGATAEREGDEPWTVGPSARIELPIFDQGQAAVARLDAELRQSRHRLAALAVDARSEVREARGRVVLARALAEHYRKVVIPLRERIVALTQQRYDAMLLGVYQLLAAKQAEIDTYREYIEAVRDYWIAWSELERAAGGRVPRAPGTSGGPTPEGSASPSTTSTTPTHEHSK